MDSSYTVFISMFEPIDPVFSFGAMDHLGVFISEFSVFFMDGVVEIMALNLVVYFSCEFSNFVPLLREGI